MALVSKAPGRVCLFGDHQDYLELPIIACAIDRYATISGIENNDDFFRISMPDIDRVFEVRFRETGPGLVSEPDSTSHTTHLIDALAVVARYGCVPDKGYDISLQSTVPINAGLSSSSAIVVAWVQWLLHTFGCDREITPEFIGQLAYEAEVLEKSSSGGKMDQYTSALGNTIYLETDEQSNFTRIENKLCGLIIGESGVPKDTEGLLGDLKGNQLRTIETVRKTHPDFNIKTATLADFEKYKGLLSTDVVRFFYASIKNHLITQEALKRFFATSSAWREESAAVEIGRLMTGHHTVLKDSLKITVPKIDAMIDAALEAGAYGAKIVGSGGGGSICALAPEGKENQIIKAIKQAGARDAYQVQIAKGAYIL